MKFNPKLNVKIASAMYDLMYDTAALFRAGRGSIDQINCLLDNLMDNFAEDFTTFDLITLERNPLTITGKEELRNYYFNDATQTYAGYVLHGMTNVQAIPHPAPQGDNRKFARMRAFQYEVARVSAAPGVDLNILIIGDYDFIWVKKHHKWYVWKMYIADDRIINLEPLILWSRQYSGQSPELPSYQTIPFPPSLAWPLDAKFCYPPSNAFSAAISTDKESRALKGPRYASLFEKINPDVMKKIDEKTEEKKNDH